MDNTGNLPDSARGDISYVHATHKAVKEPVEFILTQFRWGIKIDQQYNITVQTSRRSKSPRNMSYGERSLINLALREEKSRINTTLVRRISIFQQKLGLSAG